MTSKKRSFRKFRNPIGCLILLAAFAASAGCSTSTPGGGLVDASGKHPAEWVTSHTVFAVQSNGTTCTSCHGGDLTGGISKQSCFLSACHHKSAINWPSPLVHGASAKNVPGNSGFASCQICHGNDFSGGGSGIPCSRCHGIPAPHPGPWRKGAGATTYLHSTTHPSNAPACAQCHRSNNLNPTPSLNPTPAPPATPPGCFNNTLCHGQNLSPHPTGWGDPTQHGGTAKALPSGSSGFSYCQACHGSGNDFAGGTAGVSCYTGPCHLGKPHGVDAPHPKNWLSRDNTASNHRGTNEQNAPVCAFCHTAGAKSPIPPPTPPAAGTPPGCFNSTLCHGAIAAPHALGNPWTTPGPAFHGLTAKQDLPFCQTCHSQSGSNPPAFAGGTASTKCTTCHTTARAHPTVWWDVPATGFPPYKASHRNSDPDKVRSCGICHDVIKINNVPRTAPDPAAPSCFSASYSNSSHPSVPCHSNGPGQPNHAVPFLGTVHTAATQTSFDQNCAVCHGISAASPLATAPPCTTCHLAGSPLSTANCTSCHVKPPSGTTYPNVAGKHAKHETLANVTGVCTSCHNNLDSGTAGHYNRANARPGKDALRIPPGDAAFLAVYNARAGAASFDNATLTCANVSCHGAVTAPSWQTGTINPNTDAGCRACHKPGTAAGIPEYNSPFSGLHLFHLDPNGPVRATCIECHNMSNGTTGAGNHFKLLNTPQMEGPARQTVEPGGSATNYNAANQSCTVICHAVQHTNFFWQGGASHAVPFLGTAHTTVDQASFTGNCSACHAFTGSSPLALAPTCVTCHQSATALPFANCTSCHVKPPSGTTYPNVAGKHGKHDALASVTGVCGVCHNGLDTGSQSHYDRANARPGRNGLRVPPGDAAFLATFNAKAGAASFSPADLTCANVSCHGAITAPSWQTGTINGNADTGCRACHKIGTALGDPENNSEYSGLHSFHLSTTVGGAILCTECHNMANGTTGAGNHFKFLNTPQMEGPASQTVEPNGSAANYSAANQTCGNFTCHTKSHAGSSWSGGADHGVPFLDSRHTGTTSTFFTNDCGRCHAVSGTSPFPSAPVCQICHKAGSPLSALNCTSCHASPPSGTTYANVAGKHAVHGTLQGVTGVCTPCHNGLESGSLGHYQRANGRQTTGWVQPGDVALLGYNAKSGTASFNTDRTCSNVICHGGQTTPDWQTAIANAIDVPNACLSCHVSGTAQYNSYNSGQHTRHTNQFGLSATTCKRCHDVTKVNVTGHFQNLATIAFEQLPRNTILPAVQYNGTTCNPAAGGLTGCHGSESWQ